MQRQRRGFKDIDREGIVYGTLPYRAIEVLLGDSAFGKPMDIRAIGCIFCELAVCVRLFRASASTAEMVQECFAQLSQQDKFGCLGGLPKNGDQLSSVAPSLLISGSGFTLLPVATPTVSFIRVAEFRPVQAA